MTQLKTTILFVHGICAIGGAERELLAILTRLHQQDVEVVLVCPAGGTLTQEVGHQGIPIRSVPFTHWRKWSSFLFRFWAVRRLRNVIRSIQPSLIHVNDIWWVPQTLRASDGMGIPVVGHVRQEIEPFKVKQYRLERLDMALAVSHQIRRSLEEGGVATNRSRTLYSGLDLSDASLQGSGAEVRAGLEIPQNGFLLGTVANLFPRKGYEVMLRAFRDVLAVVPNVSYLIVGSGKHEYEKTLRSYAKSLGIDQQVHFVGFQKSIYPYLDAIDLYVHPSLMEGFGIAVIEAMVMGKAVVASAVGGLPEILSSGETGLLVPPADPDALAHAIIHLLQNSEQRQDFGKAGRKRASNFFTADGMMAQLTSTYREILNRSFPASERV